MMMLMVAGLFLVAMGTIWGLQGAGLLDWPAGSFMLGRAECAVRGIATAAAGAALLAIVRFRNRR
ncbi:MAG: hypothetical protein EAY70_11965 [Sphingomonadales bacterium]|nr:MAG: hypothetical protein EAY70_11965 [Sphingomonadales bacterium]